MENERSERWEQVKSAANRLLKFMAENNKNVNAESLPDDQVAEIYNNALPTVLTTIAAWSFIYSEDHELSESLVSDFSTVRSALKNLGESGTV
ncbi:hypothetical protein DZF79_28960 [Vibrio parahaemolyticus]|nr:hypothetical protein [Vibrio parahaemolyticus]